MHEKTRRKYKILLLSPLKYNVLFFNKELKMKKTSVAMLLLLSTSFHLQAAVPDGKTEPPLLLIMRLFV